MNKFNIVIFTGLFGILGQKTGLAATQSKSLAIKTARYSVPVPSELASVATFKVQSVELSETANGLNVVYVLPPEIVGANAEAIHLSTAGQDINRSVQQMNGSIATPNGMSRIADASCSRHPLNPKAVNCMIVYDSLTINDEAVSDFLGTEYQNSADLSKRREVAALFANEPIGILVLELE